MEFFKSKSMKELQTYLHQRGVPFSKLKKADLVNLCVIASDIGIEVDPDGLLEDRESVIKDKLEIDEHVRLTSPQLLTGSPNLSVIPPLGIFDIYNFLMTFKNFNHASLRDYQKMEGYTLFKDGYVLNVESVVYADNPAYVALKSRVKPRTNEKDPVSKLGYYSVWLMLINDPDKGTIKSAYCTCKGGIDGCCRHAIATLFEVLDFTQDHDKSSCTSGPCNWVRRSSEANKLSKPVAITDLQTSMVSDNAIIPVYTPLHISTKRPDRHHFLEGVKKLYPSACILDATHLRSDLVNKMSTKQLLLQTPQQKVHSFNQNHVCLSDDCICSKQFLGYLRYSDEEVNQINECTQGQSSNENWHTMRKGLLTASKFKTVCHSQDYTRTAHTLISCRLDESRLPPAIIFGRKFEEKARQTFIKSHRYKHRQCKLTVPGLVVMNDGHNTCLGCSPDGIVECKECGKFLVEVKCSYTNRMFHPKVALKMSKSCDEGDGGVLKLKTNHEFYYQIQGQMGVTGVEKCVLVYYTHKGIHCIDIDFDNDFWEACKIKLVEFYI